MVRGEVQAGVIQQHAIIDAAVTVETTQVVSASKFSYSLWLVAMYRLVLESSTPSWTLPSPLKVTVVPALKFVYSLWLLAMYRLVLFCKPLH